MKYTRLIGFGLIALLAPGISPAQEHKKRPKNVTEREPTDLNKRPTIAGSGASFHIGPIAGIGQFTVTLTDGSGKVVTGMFTPTQIEVFEAVLVAAKAFALTDEKVGYGSPIITRLMDQHEWSLFVDVAKVGNTSKFYVSLVTPNGKLTAEAGEITRGSKEQSALLLDVLTQVQEARAILKPPR
ncbi:MAG TPA: hypothetical protein VKF81_04295 [Blastocatellia bacterium]|nr:hypothetical protein [Blastocatellia bacterium]